MEPHDDTATIGTSVIAQNLPLDPPSKTSPLLIAILDVAVDAKRWRAKKRRVNLCNVLISHDPLDFQNGDVRTNAHVPA